MLQLKNYSLEYVKGKRVIDKLNLSVREGDIYAFVGRNGVGKTTTIKSIVGINHITDGDILLDKVSILDNPIKYKSMIAYVPDNPILYEHLTGIQYLNFIADIFELTYKEREKAIKEYMDEYAINYQQVLKLVNDEKSLVLLSADNYKQDGPEFIKTKEYITDTKTKFNKSFDKLSKMSSEKYIMENITKQNLGTYYENLYKELMFNKMITRQELNNIKTELDKDKKELINRLETEEAVINFLIENKDNWTVNNDKIVFKKTETLNQYNELVGKINK